MAFSAGLEAAALLVAAEANVADLLVITRLFIVWFVWIWNNTLGTETLGITCFFLYRRWKYEETSCCLYFFRYKFSMVILCTSWVTAIYRDMSVWWSGSRNKEEHVGTSSLSFLTSYEASEPWRRAPPHTHIHEHKGNHYTSIPLGGKLTTSFLHSLYWGIVKWTALLFLYFLF